MDKKENGLLMPDSAEKAKKMKRAFYHCGPHSTIYSPIVRRRLEKIKDKYEGDVIDEAGARAQVSALQSSLRANLSRSGATPRRLR